MNGIITSSLKNVFDFLLLLIYLCKEIQKDKTLSTLDALCLGQEPTHAALERSKDVDLSHLTQTRVALTT